MSKVCIKKYAVVVTEAFLILWMFLNAFVTSTLGFVLILIALIVGAIQYLRIPPLRHSRINDRILNIFKIDEEDFRKNTIFHKGGAAIAPGNTIEAIKKAVELGVAGVEIDVSMTKDDVCVLFHGPNLDEATEGCGLVHEQTYQELLTLNASYKDANRSKYPVTRIPKLEDCVEECIKNNMLIFFDCKGNSGQTVSAITDLYRKFPELYGLGVVCSFYPQTIYALRMKDSNIVTALTMRNYILELNGDGTQRNKEIWKRAITPFLDSILMWLHIHVFWFICGNSLALINKGNLSEDLKNHWQKLGVHVVAWTVNCPWERQFLTKSLGIPVITDGLTMETVCVNVSSGSRPSGTNII